MDFDFSEDAKALGEQARKFFAERAGPAAARAAMDGGSSDALWREVVALGWTAARVPEAHGGVGMTAEAACALAEEAGRSLAPIPLIQTLVATEALVTLGTDAQQARWLPGIADGSVVAVAGWAEGGTASPAVALARVDRGTMTGTKTPVADAAAARCAVVSGTGADGVGLYLVDLAGPGVAVAPVATLDLVRPHASITLTAAPAEPLGTTAGYHDWLDRAAILTAFEALGTAAAAMAMAVAYARERVAFGQTIGRYQGVKHKCADMFIKLELARAHALNAVGASDAGGPELRQAASAARVASLDALAFCAEENVQIHGGIGFTWDSDCQFYYRRNRALVAALGSRSFWAERLVRSLEQRNAVAA